MAHSQSDWNNDLTLKFVEYLSTERALWDFNDPRYKMKQKVYEAWSRISSKMNIPVEILKNKKKVLMASWRPLFRKKMASIKSGADEDEVFKPIWFAYDAMESFLGSVYDVEGALNTDYLLQQQYEEPTAPSSPSNQSQHSDDGGYVNIKQEHPDNAEPNALTKPHVAKKRKTYVHVNYDEGESLNYNFDPLNPALTPLQAPSRAKRTSEDEDDCDIYARLLARKLRKYPGRMRDQMMYRIDGLLLEHPYPDEPPSPCSTNQKPPYS